MDFDSPRAQIGSHLVVRGLCGRDEFLRRVDEFLLVHYEHLVLEPERELRRIFSYLDMPWSDRCMEKVRVLSNTTRGASINNGYRIDNSTID